MEVASVWNLQCKYHINEVCDKGFIPNLILQRTVVVKSGMKSVIGVSSRMKSPMEVGTEVKFEV